MRLAVSAGLLAVLFMRVEWGSVLDQARHLRPTVAALAVMVFGVQLLVSSWKWQWALRIHDLHFPYPFLTRGLAQALRSADSPDRIPALRRSASPNDEVTSSTDPDASTD